MTRYLSIFLGILLLSLPNAAHGTRYMWCWSNDSITNNVGTARQDLYDFCAAPFGDTTKAVTVLYYYAEGEMPDNDVNLRNFLEDAHSHGFKILYLDGDANWVTSDVERMIGQSFMDAVITFNEGSNDPAQRFDGVQFDVEPQSASGWASNESTYWSEFTTLLGYCQSQINAYNADYSPAIYFESTMARNWDTDGDPITSNTQVQDICDSVNVLDYQTTVTNITTNAVGEISYADSISKKIVIGVETGNYNPGTITFYSSGDRAMESTLTPCNSTFSTHSSYQGISIDDYDTYRDLVCPSCPPLAYFSGTPTSGSGSFTVAFTDGSGNNPSTWNWDFGDGGTATTQNPSHQYAAVVSPTCYPVTLIVSNAYGTSTAIYPNYICIYDNPPNAGFYGTPTSGSAPLQVNFTDTSANTPTSWNWNFGDGSTSNLQNPTHIYTSVGVPTGYNVQLVATNQYGSNTVTQANYISVSTSAGFHGGIIWDFDSTATSPITVIKNDYFYSYANSTVNNNGIGGSQALQILVPYEGAGKRHSGGGIWLSNIPGWTTSMVNATTNNINLINGVVTSNFVYWSIIASNTSNFGVSFAVYDTTGRQFIPDGSKYVGDSVQLTGTISTTAFQKLTWNVANFHGYVPGETTGTPPALSNINAFQFFFPVTPKNSASGNGSGSTALSFYLDNIGATVGTVPVELWYKY